MDRYPLYIFDLDGTLYRGEEPIQHAASVVSALVSSGSQVRYLTNNSGAPPEHLVAKLQRMGFPVSIDEVMNSTMAASKYLLNEGVERVFAVGEPGMVHVLRSSRLQVVNAGDDGVLQPDGDASESVLVGICRSFSYNLMSGAMQRLLAGQRFVATNADATFPLEGGRIVPGAGSIVAGIQTCSGREPFVVGKPNPYMIQLLLAEAAVSAADALVVGDRLNTDIESGRRAGCPTHLVLTGVTTQPPEGETFSEDLRGLL